MKDERSSLIKAITTPLGFFALSLLIVEGFLGIVLGIAKNQSGYFYFVGVIIGAILFLIVIILVWLLVWYRPQNIVRAGKDYIESEKIRAKGNKDTPLQKDLKSTNETTKKNPVEYYPELTEEEKNEILEELERK